MLPNQDFQESFVRFNFTKKRKAKKYASVIIETTLNITSNLL